jgi:hypothetical protein
VSDKADIEPDISVVIDRKETVTLMEPLLIAEGSRHRGELTDLAIEVAARSAGFRRSLSDGVRTALAELVRARPKSVGFHRSGSVPFQNGVAMMLRKKTWSLGEWFCSPM